MYVAAADPASTRCTHKRHISSSVPVADRGVEGSLPWIAASSDDSAVDVRIVAADVDDDVSDADVN